MVLNPIFATHLGNYSVGQSVPKAFGKVAGLDYVLFKILGN